MYMLQYVCWAFEKKKALINLETMDTYIEAQLYDD